jgi:PAS domain S-box-containing protein
VSGGRLLRSYEGQIKVFLLLLVLFLAVAIYLNFHLLVVARDAIQDETSAGLTAQADVVRAELERDQMLRGLRGDPGVAPYIPPAFLGRLARIEDLLAIEIIGLDGRVISSSDPNRVGGPDGFLNENEAARGRLAGGGRVVSPLDRPGGSAWASLTAYRPIQDKSRRAIAIISVRREVPALASVDLNLKLIAAIQTGGLGFVLVLVVVFARWLLQPYRRLLAAAGEAPGALTGLAAERARDEPDYLVGAFQGVLDKLRAQEQEVHRLREERGAVLPGEALVRGMTSAVLVFDRGGRLTVLNPSAERLLGAGRAEAVGRKYGDLLGDSPRLVELIERGLRFGESVSREVVPLAPGGGAAAHLGAMIAPIRSPGTGEGGEAVEGVLCLLADLTEIKSLRERVGLKENLASLGEMSAGIAHEFRNALATIQGLARLISRIDGNGGGALQSARDHAEVILREVGGVRKIVDDFLRYARPAALDLAEVDVETLIADLVREFGDDPAHRGIRVAIEGRFPRLVADETLLRQALHNLLANAAESFTGNDADHPDDARADRRIVLRGVAEAGGLRLVVEDNGGGIRDEDLPRLFTPFFTTKERGSGLGLALVQKTAVVHDGRVEVENVPGGGARFTLVLPARPGGAPAIASGGAL